jgi:hypothetical protein
MNKKQITLEINNMKYLLEYQKGKVISEQKHYKLNEDFNDFALTMVFIGGLAPFMRYFGSKLGEFIIYSALSYQDKKDFKKLFNNIKSDPNNFKLTYEKLDDQINMIIESNNDLGSIHYSNIELPISFSIDDTGSVTVTYMSEDKGQQELSFNMGKKAYKRIEQLTEKFGEKVSEDELNSSEKLDESGYGDLKSRVNKDKEISTKAHKFGENFSIIVSGIIRALKLNFKRLSELPLDRSLIRLAYFLKIELFKLETLIDEHKKRNINNPLTSEDLEFYDIDLNEIISKAHELSSLIEDLKQNSDYFDDGGNWLEQTEEMLENLLTRKVNTFEMYYKG